MKPETLEKMLVKCAEMDGFEENTGSVEGFSNYLADRRGFIWSTAKYKHRLKFRIIRGCRSKTYTRVLLKHDCGAVVPMMYHRFIAKAFLPNPLNKTEVNHKNGNKSDNRVSNLEWVTRSENTLHSYAQLGRVGVRIFGGENKTSKLVSQFSLDGVFIKTFGGIHEAQRETGANNICQCCKGTYKSSGGFKWKYA